jgi:hypothetical protein
MGLSAGPFILVATAFAVLVGCGAGSVREATGTARPGDGVVASVAPVQRSPSAPAMQAPPGLDSGGLNGTLAGGSPPTENVIASSPPGGAYAGEQIAKNHVQTAYRVTVNMDDGSVQSVIADSSAIKPGDRVSITPHGRLVRP